MATILFVHFKFSVHFVLLSNVCGLEKLSRYV